MNFFTRSVLISKRTTQIIRTMKISVFLLLVSIFPVIASNAYSQNTEIAFKQKNISLESVIQKIEASTSYRFLYRTEQIDIQQKVNVSVTKAPVIDILNNLSKSNNLNFKILDHNLIVLSPNKLSAKFKVTGTVVSAKSTETLIGVSIKEKGTAAATITDVNGAFTIYVSSPDAILEISYMGYEKQEIPVNNNSQLTIRLIESVTTLDEVVVVAFGTQKKTDMVGSVTSIKMSELKTPSSNLTSALAGRVAGIIAYQRGGEPGQDNADFFIRGVTTFGYKTSPLILVDGMERTTQDLARLQPDDISSFSIMKDATSTALYGARGANGVILVTTKQGKVGKASLSFRIENSISAPTKNVELADPVTYMKMANEAVLTRDPLGATLYTDEKIANTGKGLNPYLYPANDWKKIMFKDYTMNQRINLNLSGGGGVARYFISGSYTKDNGIMKVDKKNNFNNNIDLKSYTLRSNVTIDVTKTTEMIVRLSGNFDDYSGPIDGGAAMYKKVMTSNPVLFPAYYPVDDTHKYVKHIMFGNYDAGQYTNPYADMTKGYKEYSSSLMLARVEVKQDFSFLTPGLSFRTMVNTNRNAYFDVSRYYNPYLYKLSGYDNATNTYKITNINEASGTEYLGYSEGPKTISSTFYMESMLNYNRTIKKNGFSGLLVYMMRE